MPSHDRPAEATESWSNVESEAPTELIIDAEGDGVVRLVGEIDIVSAPLLRQHLDGHPNVTVLDLRGVTFIDSSGLVVLVTANQNRAAADQLTLRCPPTFVCRVLEITGLTSTFRIDPGGPDT